LLARAAQKRVRRDRKGAMVIHLPFANRLEAGRLLAEKLSLHKRRGNAVVLGLPRGGVPVGCAVAERLHLPLDVVVVRKIGVPWQPELAMGAIAGQVRILDEELIQELGIGNEEIDLVVSREQAEIQRREKLYRVGLPPVELEGRSAILIDDGLAMGSTMLAAVRYVRSLHPAHVTIAVPVGSEQACTRLKREADEFVCLVVPGRFFGVGRWYRDFGEVSDIEVQTLLAAVKDSYNLAGSL
jgi:putative phosphoribosyl transferase